MKSIKNKKVELASFQRMWRARRAALQGADARGQPRRAAAAFAPPTGYKRMDLVPDTPLQQAQAKFLVPPGASIWEARFAGAWAGHLPPHRRVSKPWVAHGHRGACLEVVRHLWRLYLSDQNLAESDCPIEGLFTSSSTHAPVAASSSGGASGSGAVSSSAGPAAPALPAKAKAKARK